MMVYFLVLEICNSQCREKSLLAEQKMTNAKAARSDPSNAEYTVTIC